MQEASNALADIAAGRGAARAKPEVRPRAMSRPSSRSVSRPASPSKQPGTLLRGAAPELHRPAPAVLTRVGRASGCSGARPAALHAGAQWEEDLTADCSVDAKSRYVVAELPLRLPAVKAPLDKPNPRMGMGEQRGSHALCMP